METYDNNEIVAVADGDIFEEDDLLKNFANSLAGHHHFYHIFKKPNEDAIQEGNLFDSIGILWKLYHIISQCIIHKVGFKIAKINNDEDITAFPNITAEHVLAFFNNKYTTTEWDFIELEYIQTIHVLLFKKEKTASEVRLLKENLEKIKSFIDMVINTEIDTKEK